jgi:hypothetical protein
MLYFILIGLHTVLFGYFLYFTFNNVIITIMAAISALFLISTALYAFLTKKSYYFYFFIGIVITNIAVVFVIPLGLVIIIPELIFLYILTLRGPSPGQIYTRMKASKQVNLAYPYHDPAVTRMYGMAPGYPGLKMDEVWNPDSTKPMIAKNEYIEKGNSMWKIQFGAFILTISFLICGIISLFYFFS